MDTQTKKSASDTSARTSGSVFMSDKPTGIALFDQLLKGETYFSKPKPLLNERQVFELQEAIEIGKRKQNVRAELPGE